MVSGYLGSSGHKWLGKPGGFQNGFIRSVAAGTVSKGTGGKFANGAMTAAFSAVVVSRMPRTYASAPQPPGYRIPLSGVSANVSVPTTIIVGMQNTYESYYPPLMPPVGYEDRDSGVVDMPDYGSEVPYPGMDEVVAPSGARGGSVGGRRNFMSLSTDEDIAWAAAESIRSETENAVGFLVLSPILLATQPVSTVTTLGIYKV